MPQAPSAPAPAAPFAVAPDASPNPEAELAFRFVAETDRHVFLTGRAGTGKTTLLHRLRKELKKAYAVVAPTGVAAINAKGVTIHSQLQLPFGTLSRQRMDSPEGQRLSAAKKAVLRRIDLLIVDEVSMVRADVMDAIDVKLQRVRRDRRPFGGVQLLLIGDLHQLPPVVTRDEEREMSERYATPYFFSADALQDAGLTTVELKRVYRQTDGEFVSLLGEVRANRMSDAVLRKLNTRYREPSADSPLEGYITLTSHRRAAERINADRLRAMPARAQRYTAEVKGKFPDGSFPTDKVLELKVGAQVMFVKNDPEGAYHNGLIGTVTALDAQDVTVDCGEEGGRITTGTVRWENTAYTVGGSEGDIGSKNIGSFTQVPLRLAWAITIHKSQGLTFDRVVIDAADAFAHGQVYVALSRCRTFGGIVLRSQIGDRSVRTDREVAEYTTEQRAAAPDDEQLRSARLAYRERLIREAFDFSAAVRSANAFRRHALASLRSYPGLSAEEVDALFNAVKDDLERVGKQFAPQLTAAIASTDLDADPVPVPERCGQAANYFVGKLRTIRDDTLAGFDLSTENAEVMKRRDELVPELKTALEVSQGVLSLLAEETFDPNALISTRARLSIGEASAKTTKRSSGGKVKVTRPLLYVMLTDWRAPHAKAEGVRTNQVLSSKSMRAICAALPRTGAELKAVDGLGETKIKRYGRELLELVEKYVESGIMEADAAATKAGAEDAKGGDKSSAVSDTVRYTATLFAAGHPVSDIELVRGYKASTIYGHLADAIAAGLTDGQGILTARDYQRIAAALDATDGDSAKTFTELNGRFEHGQLKVAKALWQRAKA